MTIVPEVPLCTFPGCKTPMFRIKLCSGHISQHRRGVELKPIKPRRKPGVTCSFPGCTNMDKTLGLCNSHNEQRRAGKELTHIRPKPKFCTFEGCERFHYCNDYCSTHYAQYKTGRPLHEINIHLTRVTWATSATGYVGRTSNGKHVAQHRLVMEEHIGRPLTGAENVHHLNGVRNDNRIENLELWNTSQPSGQRVADKVAWAIELLETYSPESLAKSGLRIAPKLAA